MVARKHSNEVREKFESESEPELAIAPEVEPALPEPTDPLPIPFPGTSTGFPEDKVYHVLNRYGMDTQQQNYAVDLLRQLWADPTFVPSN